MISTGGAALAPDSHFIKHFIEPCDLVGGSAPDQSKSRIINIKYVLITPDAAMAAMLEMALLEIKNSSNHRK